MHHFTSRLVSRLTISAIRIPINFNGCRAADLTLICTIDTRSNYRTHENALHVYLLLLLNIVTPRSALIT